MPSMCKISRMKTLTAKLTAAAFTAGICCSTLGAGNPVPESSGALKTIELPAPEKSGGKPLMTAISDRASSRDFSEKEIDPENLSNLLWTIAGINRPDGKRTAGSTRNWQSVEIYAVMKSGIYRYNAAENKLEPAASGDYRKLTGGQPFVETAPLNILYVGDMEKMDVPDPFKKALFFGADIGLMSQNGYLYCASAGLGTVIRGMVENDPLAAIIKLPANKKILMAQTVGWPEISVK